MRSRGASSDARAESMDDAKGRKGVMKYVGEIEVRHSLYCPVAQACRMPCHHPLEGMLLRD